MLMAHDEAGAGAPVLLLHAGVADRRMWRPQWDDLAERFRVVRCDLRGFGETPLPPGQFSHADDVAELLDHLDLARTSLVGSSYGGKVALEFAATYPDRVERLVLLCAAFDGLEPTAAAEAFDAREEELIEAGDLEGFVDLNVETWLGPEADERTKNLVRLMQGHALNVQIAAEEDLVPPEPVSPDVDPTRIDGPAVVVSGAHDMDHFRAIAAHLADTMPQARLVELAWAGHLPSLERPEEATALIIEALTN